MAGLLRRIDRDDQLATSETYIAALGLQVSVPPKLSALGFGYENSNLRAPDIEAAIKSLGYDQPWKRMNDICASAGISTLSVQNDLANFLRRRNRAAHEAGANFGPAEVKQSTLAAFEIALCFDVLCSHFVRTLARAHTMPKALAALKLSKVSFRFLDEGPDNKWRERATTSGTAFRVDADGKRARLVAQNRARARAEVLILRDQSLQPFDWEL